MSIEHGYDDLQRKLLKSNIGQLKMFHEGRLFEFKIMQNTETVKKLRDFENKQHPLVTQKGSVHGTSHFYGRRAFMRHTYHPNMSLIG